MILIMSYCDVIDDDVVYDELGAVGVAAVGGGCGGSGGVVVVVVVVVVVAADASSAVTVAADVYMCNPLAYVCGCVCVCAS